MFGIFGLGLGGFMTAAAPSFFVAMHRLTDMKEDGFWARKFLLRKKEHDPNHIKKKIDEGILFEELQRMHEGKATFLRAREKWPNDERQRFVSAAVQGCAPHSFVGVDRSEWLRVFL